MLFIATPLFAEVGRVVEILDIQGDVQYRKGGTLEWKGAEKGMLLVEGDSIKTGPVAKATLVLDKAGETGQVNMSPNSQMRIETLQKNPVTEDKTTLLDLALGKVLVKAEKLKGNSSFQVKTPTSIAGVRGTTFEVSVD
jgi:hypothetical protein